jgi:hypothetical protein
MSSLANVTILADSEVMETVRVLKSEFPVESRIEFKWRVTEKFIIEHFPLSWYHVLPSGRVRVILPNIALIHRPSKESKQYTIFRLLASEVADNGRSMDGHIHVRFLEGVGLQSCGGGGGGGSDSCDWKRKRDDLGHTDVISHAKPLLEKWMGAKKSSTPILRSAFMRVVVKGKGYFVSLDKVHDFLYLPALSPDLHALGTKRAKAKRSRYTPKSGLLRHFNEGDNRSASMSKLSAVISPHYMKKMNATFVKPAMREIVACLASIGDGYNNLDGAAVLTELVMAARSELTRRNVDTVEKSEVKMESGCGSSERRVAPPPPKTLDNSVPRFIPRLGYGYKALYPKSTTIPAPIPDTRPAAPIPVPNAFAGKTASVSALFQLRRCGM